MNITFEGYPRTEALEQRVRTQMEKIAHHSNEEPVNIHVVFTVNDTSQRAGITLTIKNRTLHAEAENKDLYTAIDTVGAKLNRQMLSLAGKKRARRRGHTHHDIDAVSI